VYNYQVVAFGSFLGSTGANSTTDCDNSDCHAE
jgi:hypothetical protein